MNRTNLILVIGVVGTTIYLSGCVPAPEAPPPPIPQPAPPPPVMAPEPVAADWRDWPIAAGDWTYQDNGNVKIAAFGQSGQTALLTFRCDSANKRIFVSRSSTLAPGQPGSPMTVRTSYGSVEWPATPDGKGYMVAARLASDTTFDQIAFSRGRFAVEAPSAQPIAVPSWPEITRVIEDCRG